MQVFEINPFLRFADSISFKSSRAEVNVFDSRIFSVISGCADILIDGQRFNLCEGSLFYCAGGSCYSLTTSESCIINVLNFDLTQQRNNITRSLPPYKLNGASAKYGREVILDDGGDLNSYIYIKDGYGLQAKISDIINEFSQKRPLYMEKCSAMLKDSLIEIYRSRMFVKTPSLKTLEKVISYINLNLNKKITNAELAAKAGYHEYHLNRLFLKHIGKTIHQYIIDARIEKAKSLLATTDMTIVEIAESAGFNSSTHLCGCFKSAVGLVPSEYRKIKYSDSI